MAYFKRKIKNYVYAWKRRFLDNQPLKVIAQELNFSIQRASVLTKWTQFQLNNPKCKWKEILKLRKELEKIGYKLT